jgi:hypothetical protein
MGYYADLIRDEKLLREVQRSTGRDDITQTDVDKLEALVWEVADACGLLFDRIPLTFRQYTEHNIRHCRNLIYLMGRFIPAETLERLNALELSILILSALLHDSGMVVSDKEKAEALESAQFHDFAMRRPEYATAAKEARENGEEYKAGLIDDALLAEYYRKLHPERAAAFVKEQFKGRLTFRDTDFTKALLQVCESHAWGVQESNDPTDPNKSVRHLETRRSIHNVPVNLQYLACCLRLADIMDFDRSRTPMAVFQHTMITEAVSWQEWNKHLSVTGWHINEREVQYTTECEKPAYYVAVMEFLDWIDAELRDCRRLIMQAAPATIAEKYMLYLPPVVDRYKVEMADENYVAGAFRFQLDYERIMQLLMDKSLYPDPSLFLRELLQNSLDACRHAEAIAREHRYPGYEPHIVVWDHSDDPDDPRIVFQDNGMGMSRQIVERYFMQTGRSYYRSAEFDYERQRLAEKGIEVEACSRFGIGILACFMIGDRIEVETYRHGSRPLHIDIEGPTKYFTIRQLPEPKPERFCQAPNSYEQDGPPGYPGTRITVHLRGKSTVAVLETLDVFAANVDYDLSVNLPGEDCARIVRRLRWEPSIPDPAEHMGPFYRAASGLSAHPIGDVLQASRIELEQYEFSEYLRGSLWLWLLRGPSGGVSIERGCLAIDGDTVACTGLASLIGSAQTFVSLPSGVQWRDLSWAVQSADVDDSDISVHFRDVWQAHGNQKAKLSRGESDLIEQCLLAMSNVWCGLTSEERQITLTALTKGQPIDKQWYAVPGLPEKLLSSNHDWILNPPRLNVSFRLPNRPRDLALHGIRIPGGVVHWDPSRGAAKKVEIGDFPGGAQIDARSPAAPIPAASRLFVTAEQGEHVLGALWRAIARHACVLAFSRSHDANWRSWFSSLLSPNLQNQPLIHAMEIEREFLRSKASYSMHQSDGSTCFMYREEIVTKVGRWIPLVPLLGTGNYKGIWLEDDIINEFLIRDLQRRNGDHGLEEVQIVTS